MEIYRRRRERLSIVIANPMLSRAGLRTNDARNEIFCSARCEQDHAMHKALFNHASEMAEKTAAERWPGCPSYVSKRYPYLSSTVIFRPEGLEFDARWDPVADDVFVAQSDKPAWDAYIERLNAERIKDAA